MRDNYKVSMTAAASSKQGDVESVNFGLDGYNNLVIDVSICYDHILIRCCFYYFVRNSLVAVLEALCAHW